MMIENERNSLQYDLTLSSFKDQVYHKQLIIEKFSFDLGVRSSKESKEKENCPGKRQKNFTNRTNCEFIRWCRKNIDQIQKVFVDTHNYFVELKFEFIFDLFSAIFKNMIMLFKLLSEKYMNSLKEKGSKIEIGEKTGSKQLQKLGIQLQKPIKESQIQYLDQIIKDLQVHENDMQYKSLKMEQKIQSSRERVQNIHPSDAVNQLQNLKRHFERISAIYSKLNDFNKIQASMNLRQFEQIKEPRQIQIQYCSLIAERTKQSFVQKMLEMKQGMILNIRQEYKQQLMREINSRKPTCAQQQSQTQQMMKKGDKGKQKTVLSYQNEQLRKSVIQLRRQVFEMSREIQKVELARQQLQKKLQIATQLVNRKNTEIQKMKADYDYQMNRKQRMVESLNLKIVESRKKQEQEGVQTQAMNQSTNCKIISNQFDDVASEKEQTKSLKIQYLNKGQSSSYYYQKQFKATKQQNQHLRKSLTHILDSLRDQKLILDYPIAEFNDDIKMGNLINKIESISIEVLQKVKEIRENNIKIRKRNQDFDNSPSPQKNTRSQRRTIFHEILEMKQAEKIKQPIKEIKNEMRDMETQTLMKYQTSFQQQDANIYERAERKSRKSNRKSFVTLNNKKAQNQLEKLKIELINQITSAQRQGTLKRSRLYLHQIENIKNQMNKSFSKLSNLNYKPEDEATKRISKTNFLFNRKDISFESFKFVPFQNGSYYPNGDKKMVNGKKATKAKNSIKDKDRQKYRESKRQNNKSCDISNSINMKSNLNFTQVQSTNMEPCTVMETQLARYKYEIKLLVKKMEQMSASFQDWKQIAKTFVQEIHQRGGHEIFQDVVPNLSR